MRSELGRIWPPPPLAGRGPNPPASLTGWRPSRGQLRRPVRDANSDSTREPTPPEGGERRSLRGSSRVPASLTGCPARPYLYRVVQATREGRCIRQLRARPPSDFCRFAQRADLQKSERLLRFSAKVAYYASA